MENPFNYLQFATGDRFYDREEIRRDLKSRLLSGQTNVVLYGPRRYGKSSLVAELTADLEKAGTPIGPLDMMIAGHAKSLGYTVVTNNTKEFERVKGLKLENWAD